MKIVIKGSTLKLDSVETPIKQLKGISASALIGFFPLYYKLDFFVYLEWGKKRKLLTCGGSVCISWVRTSALYPFSNHEDYVKKMQGVWSAGPLLFRANFERTSM